MRRQLIAIALLAAPVIAGAQQMTDTTFHQISLADALRLAHDNSLSNIQADNAIRSAGNTLRATRAAMYPTLNATASQGKSAGDRLGQSGQLVPYTGAWTYSTGLNSSVTLFDAGKMFADVRTQQANVAAAQASEVNTEYSVGLSVKQAYNSVLAAKESEAAAQAQLATAQQQLAVSVAKVNAGAATVSDSLRSVVQVGNAQLNVLTAQNSFRTSSAALTRLVGTPYFVTAQLSDTVDHPVAPIDSVAIMALALNGPTIRAAQASMNAASAAERSAKTAYLPTVQASFNFSGSGAGAAYGLNGNPYPYSRGVNVNISYPIFNRFQRENTIASAQINYDNAAAQMRDAKLGAQQNVITAIASMRNAEETMRVQQINVRASEEDLRVVQQRYNLGASTLVDVLTSQGTLVTARQSLIQARLNYRNARAQLEAAIGHDLP